MGFYPCVAQTCQYISPKSTSLRSCQQAIKLALRQVALSLPGLQVGIGASDTNSPFFLRLPSLNLTQHLEWRDLSQTDQATYEETWLRALEVQHTTDWQHLSSKPPWKLTVFQSPASSPGSGFVFDFLFAAHHALCDGKSMLVFHDNLTAALNKLGNDPSDADDLVILPPSPNLTPSQESLINFDISISYLLKTLWGEFAPAWLRGKSSTLPWTGSPIDLAKCPSHMRLITVPARAVTDLLTACRAHQTTITPLLNALVTVSISRNLPAENTGGGLIMQTVIGTRPFADKAKIPEGMELDKSTGDMATGLVHEVKPSVVSSLRASENSTTSDPDFPIWDLTATLSAELKARLATLPHDDVTGMLHWVSDWFKRARKQQGMPREHTWELSNVGSLPAATANVGAGTGWNIRRAVFSQSCGNYGAAFSVNISSVPQGPMVLCLAWGDGVVESSLMDALKEDLDTWFQNLVDTGNFNAFGPLNDLLNAGRSA